MGDLSLGTYDFLTRSVASSSGGIGSAPTAQNYALPPPVNTDNIGEAAGGVAVSFFNGLSTIIGGLAGSAIAAPGTVVGTDNYGNPIRQQYTRSGVPYSSATSAWPGSPGSPDQYPERAMQYGPTQGPWGWLTNMLSLPAPKPDASLGTIPGTYVDGNGVLRSAPKGIPPWMIVIGIGLLGLVVVRTVTR